MASEMLYPVMPIYLKSIGFSILLIGVLEGIAEAIAGLTKGYFGHWSDVSGKRAPFVQTGYALSALSKPMMALSSFPGWIFFARTLDRLGKGIRTGARDALLSGEATPANKGRVFGFHRSMDTIGAVLGPLLALAYLQFHPQDYKTLFLLAVVPGVLAIGASFLLRDKAAAIATKKGTVNPFAFLRYWEKSPPLYRKVVLGLLVFTLFNSSDVFLLLKMKQEGLSDTSVIGVYIFYNLVYVFCAFPIGVLADRWGLKPVFTAGLGLFCAVYVGISFNGNLPFYLVLFLLYGVYAAATEGIAKAWISNITDPKDTATAIGVFAGFQSICTLLASSLAGLLWFQFGASFTLLLTATATGLVVAYFVWFVPRLPLTEH